ncbi:hypothetical protein ISS07_01185 [Candidatus Woesearchaeota archaeon]|nr:hypothetical protein [Candidatus Woesearchaeota archaeon]
MKKFRWIEWVGIIPSIFLIVLVGLIYFITNFNTKILPLFLLAFLFAIFSITYILSERLQEWGEERLREDIYLLETEKSNMALIWAYISAIGFGFLMPGLVGESSNNLLLLATGLIFLILANVVYYGFYFPRYALLLRKRIVELDCKNKK